MLPVILSVQLIGGQSQPRNKLIYQCQNLLRTTTSIRSHQVIRVRIRSRKWWQPFFTWAGNASMENAWNLFRTVRKQKIGMLEFQKKVVIIILASFGRNKPAKSLAFPRNVANNVKLDIENHLFVKGTSKYCHRKYCRSIYLCQKCNVALHPDRFKDYHF